MQGSNTQKCKGCASHLFLLSSRTQWPKVDERGILRGFRVITDVDRTAGSACVVVLAAFMPHASSNVLAPSMPLHPSRKIPPLRSFRAQKRDDTVLIRWCHPELGRRRRTGEGSYAAFRVITDVNRTAGSACLV